MAGRSTFRFAAGTKAEPHSGIWRLVSRGDDVYVGGPSSSAMGLFKLSLHQSGVWTFAFTSQSGAKFADGNRRGKRWTRPLEHVEGITRGPSIIVPHTSVGSRSLMPGESGKNVHWYPAPSEGEHLDFSLYFAAPGAKTVWSENEDELHTRELTSGQRAIVLASRKPTPTDFAKTVEGLVQGFDGLKDEGHGLWVTQSTDELAVPLIVDFSVAAR